MLFTSKGNSAADFMALMRVLALAKRDKREARDVAHKLEVSDRVKRLFHDPRLDDPQLKRLDKLQLERDGDKHISPFRQGDFMYEELARRALKTAISPGTTTGTSDPEWGGALLDLHIVAAGFIESLRSVCLYDALTPFMRQVPPRFRANIVTGGFVAHNVAEGALRTISKLQITGDDLDFMRSVAICVTTADLLRFATAGTTALFQSELSNAVAQVTDATILPVLLNSITPTASSGDPDVDIGTALGAIDGSAASKYVIAGAPALIKQMASLGTNAGRRYLDLTFNGGTIANAPVLAVDSLHNYSSFGDVLLVCDANQLAGDSTVAVPGNSDQGTLQMTDAPASGEQQQVSLWQTDSVALKVERIFSFARLRAAAVAAIAHCDYSNSGSP